MDTTPNEIIKFINEFIEEKNINLLYLELLIIEDLKGGKKHIKNIKKLIKNINEYNEYKFNNFKLKKLINLYSNILNYKINIEPFIKHLSIFKFLLDLEEVKESIKNYKLN